MDNKIKQNIDINEDEATRFIVDEVATDSEDEIVNVRRSYSHHHSHSHSHHHSHSHSHSHKHHSSSSKKRNNKKNSNRKKKIERFVKHNKKYILYCLVAFVVFVCLIFVGGRLDNKAVKTDNDGADDLNLNAQAQNSALHIEVPFFSEDVAIASPAVEVFVNADENVLVSTVYDKYSATGTRLDAGLPVELSYEISGIPAGYNVKKAEIIVADNKYMSQPRVFVLEGYETKVDVYNLKTGTQYYYTINLTFSNEFETSVSGSFRTAEGPRMLNVDGVYNMRDIGGWKTASGKTIKQGLLYRGTEIDGAVEPKYTISEAGINTMLTELGIKTDMDLRSEHSNIYGTDVLGAAVKHKYYNTEAYSAILTNATNKENIRKVFSDLSDKNNYPVYLHCTYGQDRTGTICYLLEALLGVDEKNLMKDFLLSGLHHGDVYGGIEPMDEFILALKKLPGASMSEKAECYLKAIGVTAEEISRIKNIFLAD